MGLKGRGQTWARLQRATAVPLTAEICGPTLGDACTRAGSHFIDGEFDSRTRYVFFKG